MIEQVENLSFLRDITDQVYDPNVPTLFKNTLRVYEVVDCPSVVFKISSDWDGNWMAGAWYTNFGRTRVTLKIIFRHLSFPQKIQR